MRLIDADALMQRAIPHGWSTPKWVSDIMIDDAPTIDPVKHGKWDKISDRNYKCSSCNAWWTVDRDSTIKDFEYCPHCGARMDL